MTLPRIVTSSKFQSAFVVTLLGAIPVLYQLSDKAIPREDKTKLLQTWIAGATATWIAAIGGTALEDFSRKPAPPAPAPSPPVTVNAPQGDVVNQQSPATAAVSAPPVVPPAPGPGPGRPAGPVRPAPPAAYRPPRPA